MQLFFFSLINRLYSLRACTYASLFSSLLVPFFSGVSHLNAFSRRFAFLLASLQSLSHQRVPLTSEFTPTRTRFFMQEAAFSRQETNLSSTESALTSISLKARLSSSTVDCLGQRWPKIMQLITVPNNFFSQMKIFRFVHIVTCTLICTCIYWNW